MLGCDDLPLQHLVSAWQGTLGVEDKICWCITDACPRSCGKGKDIPSLLRKEIPHGHQFLPEKWKAQSRGLCSVCRKELCFLLEAQPLAGAGWNKTPFCSALPLLLMLKPQKKCHGKGRNCFGKPFIITFIGTSGLVGELEEVLLILPTRTGTILMSLVNSNHHSSGITSGLRGPIHIRNGTGKPLQVVEWGLKHQRKTFSSTYIVL